MQNEVIEDEVTEATPAAEKHQAVRPTHEAIAILAYETWEENGRPEGTAESDWLRAEAILMQEFDQENAEV